MLFYVQGLTYLEAANELDISMNAPKARLHSARAALTPKVAYLGPHEEEPAMSPNDNWIEMQIVEVRRGAETGVITPHVVVLREKSGPRHLPIWTGSPEATALAVSLSGTEMPRPMTYQLASNLVAAAGAHVAEVRITRLSESTFYAIVTVDGPAGRHEIDARPSDALNLALLRGAPIKVNAEMLADPAAARAERQTYSVTASDIVTEVHQRQEAGMRFLQKKQSGCEPALEDSGTRRFGRRVV